MPRVKKSDNFDLTEWYEKPIGPSDRVVIHHFTRKHFEDPKTRILSNVRTMDIVKAVCKRIKVAGEKPWNELKPENLLCTWKPIQMLHDTVR